MKKILIRFDDICPTMDMYQFKRAMDLLDRFNVKPLVGVIPDCKDHDLMIDEPLKDFWSFIRGLQKNGYTIAMHGYQHVFDSLCKGKVNNRIGSEFAGHTLEEQVKKIKEGKSIFSKNGIETDVFFAPAHSYDDNTYEALSICGFKYMSDGKSSKPYIKSGIKTLPCRSSGCPKIGSDNIYTAVFHAHEWAKPEKKQGYFQLEQLLKNHREYIVSFEEYANISTGNSLIQQIDERIFVLWQIHIRPILVNLYHIIFK